GLSALNIWLPSSDRTRDCQFGAEASGTASPLRQDCSQTAQTIAVPPSPKTDVIVSQRATTNVPKRITPVQSRASNPIIAATPPKRPIDQSQAQAPAQPKAGQAASIPPIDSGSYMPNRMVEASQEDESAGSLIDSPPVTSHTSAHTSPDMLLAEQG